MFCGWGWVGWQIKNSPSPEARQAPAPLFERKRGGNRN